jgi:hypothetical protein
MSNYLSYKELENISNTSDPNTPVQNYKERKENIKTKYFNYKDFLEKKLEIDASLPPDVKKNAYQQHSNR